MAAREATGAAPGLAWRDHALRATRAPYRGVVVKSFGQLTPGQRCIEAIREVLGKSPLYMDPVGRSVLGDTEQQDMVRFYVAPPSTDGRVLPHGRAA